MEHAVGNHMEHAVGNHEAHVESTQEWEGFNIPPFVGLVALALAIVIIWLTVGLLGYNMLLPTPPFTY